MSLINLEDYGVGKLTKRQRREVRKQQSNSLKIRSIQPKTQNQKRAFDHYDEEYNLLLHGLAGTGKTFISLYLALSDVLSQDCDQHNVTIVRSVVPTRDMGFLPGSEKEKSKVYEAPYSSICSELFGRGDAYEILKTKNLINFVTTSYIRGLTLDDTIVIVDECQNMTDMELHSVITRIGENSRIIFSGDFRQNDLIDKRSEESGIIPFMNILRHMNCFKNVEFEEYDIVRSDLVKEYIIIRNRII